ARAPRWWRPRPCSVTGASTTSWTGSAAPCCSIPCSRAPARRTCRPATRAGSTTGASGPMWPRPTRSAGPRAAPPEINPVARAAFRFTGHRGQLHRPVRGRAPGVWPRAPTGHPPPSQEGLPRVKILWHSNAPAPMSNTGYGNQTALSPPRFRNAGHDIAISCMTGMSGFPSEWDGIPLLPAGLGMYSADILEPHARRHFGREPGLVLVHYDAWAIGPEAVMGLATA